MGGEHRDVVQSREVVEWEVSYSHVEDKNQVGYLRREGSKPQVRQHSTGF